VNTPTISLIIPAYNAGHFIEEALESCCGQSFPFTEGIIVDDGSTVPVSLPSFAQKHFRVISQRNSGQAHARNVGVRQATGEWIAFLDADDVWHPQKLHHQVAALANQPNVSCVGCRAVLINEGGAFSGIGPGMFSGRVLELDREQFVLEAHLAGLVPSMALVRRTAILELGGFESSFQPIEDVVFFDRFFAAGHKALMVDQALLKRRMYGGNLTFQFREMLRSFLSWAHRRITPELGEKTANQVRGNAFQLAGLSALFMGNDAASRNLLKHSWMLHKSSKTFLAFLVATGGLSCAAGVRQLRRKGTMKRAAQAWQQVSTFS
jgi:hypothetical protein